MKKVLYLLEDMLETIGGAQKSAKTLINQVAEIRKCYVLLPATSKNKDVRSLNAEIIYYRKIKGSVSKHCNYLKVLYDTVKKIEPDYIDAQFSQFGFDLLCYNYFFNSRRIKCIFTDRRYFDQYNKKYHLAFRLFASHMYQIVTTTEQNRQRWIEEVRGVRVTVIPNVLDENWDLYDCNKEKKIKTQTNPEKNFVIGFSGRYSAYKRWDIAYEIAKSLNYDSKYSFIFILAVHPDDGSEEFIKKVKQLKRAEIIINANESQMSDLYYAMDVFVLTSDNESFGRTLIEAMSRGTVVLGSDSGGVPEVIGNQGNLFQSGSSHSAVEKICYLKEHPEYYEKNKEYCLSRVEQNFYPGIRKRLIEILYD